jgi:hypothetical protein
VEDQHLISVDELRAAGALDVPPHWRKSLGVERDRFSLFGADDEHDEDDQPGSNDAESAGTADDQAT